MDTPNHMPSLEEKPAPFSFEVRHHDRNGELQILQFKAHSVVIISSEVGDDAKCANCDELHPQVRHEIFGVCGPEYMFIAAQVLDRKIMGLPYREGL